MTPEELLKSRHIDYRTSGADLLIRCLSPDHEDNNPSMRIDKLTGKFNCFSCGFSGDIHAYFKVTKNLLDIKVLKIKEKINKINKEKLSIPLGAEKFSKDYRGIKASTFEKFEAFTYIDSEKPEFEDRIMFPLYDVSDDIVAFQGRRINSKVPPKYINHPRKVTLPLFPPFPEKIDGSIILVEGMFDMLNLYDKGLHNAVCSLGLIKPKKRRDNSAEILDKFSIYKLQGVSTIYIMYDGDSAGREASKATKEVLKRSYIVEEIELPEGLDPGAMTQEQVNQLKELIYG